MEKANNEMENCFSHLPFRLYAKQNYAIEKKANVLLTCEEMILACLLACSLVLLETVVYRVIRKLEFCCFPNNQQQNNRLPNKMALIKQQASNLKSTEQTNNKKIKKKYVNSKLQSKTQTFTCYGNYFEQKKKHTFHLPENLHIFQGEGKLKMNKQKLSRPIGSFKCGQPNGGLPVGVPWSPALETER
ncbi:hypothetical protein T11_3005 [Trichinella zimbabwensis]|uniref:Uncharacterized protein n=1 Tax=Trichinella zimbabwensis TaxID=268475 RepID=A0A0V1GZQ1_9BILA|nr:hypothetical protein T11_3005 [Trichinella zimbabwensis]